MPGSHSTDVMLKSLNEIRDLDEYNRAVLAYTQVEATERVRRAERRADRRVAKRVDFAPDRAAQTCQPPFAHRSLFFVCDRCGKLVDTPEEQRAWRQRWIDEEGGGVVEARWPCLRCGKKYCWPWPGNPDGLCPHCIDGSRSWDEVQRRADERKRDASLSFFAAKYRVRWTPHCGDRDCDGTCPDPLCVLPDEVVQQMRLTAAPADRRSENLLRRRPWWIVAGALLWWACSRLAGALAGP
jgi:hypothetical protein